MALVNYLSVDASVIPARDSGYEQAEWDTHVAEITSYEGAQIYELPMAGLRYEITANRELLLTSALWRDYSDLHTQGDKVLLETAKPVIGRVDCWNIGYTGDLFPGTLFVLRMKHGILVEATTALRAWS